MGKHKVLTREEYAEKFKEQMNRYNYIPQAGEHIVQCKENYRNYWFISNKGYLFSAYKNDVEILKPRFDKTGVANKAGERNGKSWRYGTRFAGDKNLTRFDMGKMIVDHFGTNEFPSNDEETEIHHITKRNSFESNEAQKCNRADNLQILPKSIHKNLTKFSSKTSEEYDKDIQKKIEENNLPTYQINLMKLVEQSIKECQKLGIGEVFVMDESDPNNIKAKAYPLTAIQFIED